MKIHVGTSGWNYETFIGTLYPEGTAKRRFLEKYAERLDTVELNASFYRSFPERTWQGWYDRTPANFIWSVKGPRFITHIRRLEVEEESVSKFMDRAMILEEKLGVVLWQLPPSLSFDTQRAKAFIAMLPRDGIRHAIEARHPSWHSQEVLSLLRAEDIAWVISDTAGRYPMTVSATAAFAYVRLHGHEQLYRGLYGRDRLERWLKSVGKLPVEEVFWYFDNTDDGSAARDALTLKAMLEGA